MVWKNIELRSFYYVFKVTCQSFLRVLIVDPDKSSSSSENDNFLYVTPPKDNFNTNPYDKLLLYVNMSKTGLRPTSRTPDIRFRHFVPFLPWRNGRLDNS